jgi:outer membrane biosynthesis protein TonB
MNTFQPQKQQQPKKKRDYKVAAIVVVAVLGAAAGIAQVIKGDATPRKRVMETVALKLVPPPPPPKEPPPPPPPKMVEKQKIEPPQDKPEAPKPVEAPPAGPLALDAKGGAGSDGFGLGGKLGGADYGPGGGSPYGRFSSLVSMAIKRRLAEDDKIGHAKFHGELKVWFTAAGAVAKVVLLHGTGDPELDSRIEQAVATMPAASEAPPEGMPAAIIGINGANNQT